jgi:hypothetical protein
MVELHSTPPAGEPAEDDDCKSSIPGSAARVRGGLPSPIARGGPRECRVGLAPRRPANRRKTTTASRRSRGMRHGSDTGCRRRLLGAVPGWSSCTRLRRPAGRQAGGRRRLQVVDPGGCGTRPRRIAVADRSGQSPGMSSCTRPRRPTNRRKTTTASRRSRGDAARVRYRLPSPIARRGPRECRVALDFAAGRPASRGKTTTASRRSRGVRHASEAGCRRRSLGAIPGNVELHSTPPTGEPAEDDDCKSSIPGGAARVRCRLSSPIAPRAPRECRVALDPADRRAGGRRRLQVVDPGGVRHESDARCRRRSLGAVPRECRVALDPAGRQAGERRRLQVVDPGSRPGMSDSATRAGLALACHLK